MSLLSVFGGGLWIIPLILLLASLWSFYRANRSRNSGMGGKVFNRSTNTWEYKETKGKASWTELGSFWFGVMFLCGFIAAVVLMWMDR